jgi:hypothetical protein
MPRPFLELTLEQFESLVDRFGEMSHNRVKLLDLEEACTRVLLLQHRYVRFGLNPPPLVGKGDIRFNVVSSRSRRESQLWSITASHSNPSTSDTRDVHAVRPTLAGRIPVARC